MLWYPKSFHIELTNACVAQCPFCARTTEGGSKKHQELSIEDIKIFFTEDIIKNTESFLLCGSYGDPIYCKDILEIVEYLDSYGATIYMSTNGYNQKKDFWNRLGKTNIKITFGIDGITQSSHARHRINTNLKNILKNAKDFIDVGGYAIWQFLVFKHNEHQINTAKSVSKRLGFQNFFLRKSRDYNGILRKPKDFLELDINNERDIVLGCAYKIEERLYISSSGQVLPCCYLGDIEYYNEKLLHKKMNIKNSGLHQIRSFSYWEKDIGTFTNMTGCNKCKLMCFKNI